MEVTNYLLSGMILQVDPMYGYPIFSGVIFYRIHPSWPGMMEFLHTLGENFSEIKTKHILLSVFLGET